MFGEGKGDSLDCNYVLGFGTEIVQKLCYTLLAAAVIPEGVDDPDLAQGDCCGDSSGFRVAGDEFDVLDTASLFHIQHGGFKIKFKHLRWEL